MALTSSVMMSLGTRAPVFSLPDTISGKMITLDTFSSQNALLVMFICRHCPYVVHVKDELGRMGRDYQKSSVGMVAISSNDVSRYPEDAPEQLKDMAMQQGYTFPFCYDESQAVAQAYSAACTPDFFLFDSDRKLVYRGQMDESRPGNGKPVTGRDLRKALDAVLAGKPVGGKQIPSMGCNIKWKPGHEPAYAR